MENVRVKLKDIEDLEGLVFNEYLDFRKKKNKIEEENY